MAIDADLRFSHVGIGVSDMDRAVDFYTTVLGFETVLDVTLGVGLDGVTGTTGAAGRSVGGVIGGVTVELVGLGAAPGERQQHGRLGYTNISFSVPDLTAAHAALLALGHRPVRGPLKIEGVQMMFVVDPDGTPIGVVQFPGAARNPEELWRS